MASGLHCIVLLCLTSALWIGANAGCLNPAGRCICSWGWTQYGSRCFLFVRYAKSWADAERSCNAIGGNLASLRTTQEYEFIRHLIHKSAHKHETSWVGGYDAAQEGVWLWSDGFKFDFRNWGPHEPNNSGGKEHCMEINLVGRDYVNDQSCRDRRCFVCAKDSHCPTQHWH